MGRDTCLCVRQGALVRKGDEVREAIAAQPSDQIRAAKGTSSVGGCEREDFSGTDP